LEAPSTHPYDSPEFVSGRGCWLYDRYGSRYLDATSGSGAASLGHQHPRVVAAVREQAGRLVHTSWRINADVRVRLIARLCMLAPFARGTALMAVTGTEAIEAALKVARAFTGRKGIVAFKHAFHGKTAGSLAATWRPSFRKFANVHLDQVQVASFPADASDSTQVDAALDGFRELMTEARDAGRAPAAVIMEPIQVVEGVHAPGARFLEGVVRIAREMGSLVIFDEIYTGFGRCGSLFYCNRLEVMPDLLVVGKSLGNGLPISVVLGEQEIMSALPAGMHTSTYAGSPLACAAAHAVLDVIAETRLWEVSRRNGATLKRLIDEFSGDTGFMTDLRAEGMLLAFDCIDEDGNPSPALAKAYVKFAREDRHLLVMMGGKDDSTVVLTPPVLMNDKELAYLADGLSRVAAEVGQSLAKGRVAT
jgi:4-aminobutyrate aminotransferase/(S)-3-amino-2-methylpropionate transaminase